MAQPETPTILLIDDDSGHLRAVVEALHGAVQIITRTPGEVWYDTLRGLDLILIDWLLEDWPGRRGVAPTMSPADGVAVAGVLRSVFRHEKQLAESDQPLLVLWSGQLETLGEGLPAETPAHLIARRHGVDWIFAKEKIFEDINGAANRLIALAKARAELRDVKGSAGEIVQQLLKVESLREGSMQQRTLEDIEAAFPPGQEQLDSTAGLGFIRWLLHRILPYPCFLSDEIHLATRLGCTVDSFRNSLQTSAEFGGLLESLKYVGLLDLFSGPRWWRAGLELKLWELTKGDPFNTSYILEVLNRDFGLELQALMIEVPVVCVDATLNHSLAPRALNETVRIQPEYWPAYAEEARAPIDLAKGDKFIHSLVIAKDVQLVDE